MEPIRNYSIPKKVKERSQVGLGKAIEELGGAFQTLSKNGRADQSRAGTGHGGVS